MPDVVTTPEAESRKSAAADEKAFAQVEKWLVVIRQLASEQAKRASRA